MRLKFKKCEDEKKSAVKLYLIDTDTGDKTRVFLDTDRGKYENIFLLLEIDGSLLGQKYNTTISFGGIPHDWVKTG